MSTIWFLSKVWTKFNEMLIVWLFLMLGTWSISLYPPTLAQISTLRKVPTTSTPRSRPGEQLLFCPKPKSSPFLSTRPTEPIPGIRSVSNCSCVIQSHPGSVKAIMPALDRRLDQQMGKICNSEGIVNNIVLLGPIGPIFYTFACGFLIFPKSLLMLVKVSRFCYFISREHGKLCFPLYSISTSAVLWKSMAHEKWCPF